MYSFKQIDGHTITKFIYEVRTPDPDYGGNTGRY